MEPYVKYLLAQKEEESVTKDEIKRHREASEIWNKFMKDYLKKEGRELKAGFDRGQKPPEYKGILKEIREELIPEKKYKPATPPPAIAIGKRKRLKKLLGLEAKPQPLPDPTIRSQLRIKRGGKEILIINKNYPAYKKRKGDSLYIWETLAIHCAKPRKDEEMDYKDYIEELNRLFADFCFYLEKQKIKR